MKLLQAFMLRYLNWCGLLLWFGGGGGSSSSSTTSTTTTNQYDQRIVGGNGALIVSNSAGAIVTDRGAVDASFAFAEKISRGAADMSVASLNAVAKNAQSSLSEVAAAWADSKAGEYKLVALAALGVVGLAAFSKGK